MAATEGVRLMLTSHAAKTRDLGKLVRATSGLAHDNAAAALAKHNSEGLALVKRHIVEPLNLNLSPAALDSLVRYSYALLIGKADVATRPFDAPKQADYLASTDGPKQIVDAEAFQAVERAVCNVRGQDAGAVF